jgi:hypothetical protein
MAKANLSNDRKFLKFVRNGLLKVTKSGRVTNTKTNYTYTAVDSKGYLKVSFSHNGIHQIQTHRLVWLVHKGRIKDDSIMLNHKDGNKQNPKLSNLELSNNSHNIRHALRTGLIKPLNGEDNSQAKLTNKQVRLIRRKVRTRERKIFIKFCS